MPPHRLSERSRALTPRRSGRHSSERAPPFTQRNAPLARERKRPPPVRSKLHNTARAFRNKCTEEVERIEAEKGHALSFSDVQPLVAGKRGREAEARGDPDGGVWSAGQSVGLIDDIPSCAELVLRMVTEAEEVIARLPTLASPPRPRARL